LFGFYWLFLVVGGWLSLFLIGCFNDALIGCLKAMAGSPSLNHKAFLG